LAAAAGPGLRRRAMRAGPRATPARGCAVAAAGCGAQAVGRHGQLPVPRHGQGHAHRGGGRAAGGWWGKRERLRREERRNEELGLKSMEETHWGRRRLPEPKSNPSIDGDSGVQSTNRTHCNEALDETNAVVPSDSAHEARIESNCSPELEPLRTSASNTRS
jgi:hypothetical protein